MANNINQENITLLTCNFNDSYMTMRMIESFLKLNLPKIKIFIMDNSTTNPISMSCKQYFTVINNTNFKYTPDFNQGSMNHCAAVDFALNNVIPTDYVLLVDNDILFKDEILTLLNNYEKYDAIGEINHEWVIPDRLLPYCCIINIKKMKEQKLSYFDPERCAINVNPYKTRINYENCNLIKYSTLIYDTGASFYDDIRNNWKINNINLNKYIVHFRCGSNINEKLNNNKFQNIDSIYSDYNDFLTKNKQLLCIQL